MPKALIRQLKRLPKWPFKQDGERFAVPRSVQDVIPIRTIWDDGIFLVENKYTKTYRFEDINYSVASKEDQEAMFLEYSELLNSFDSSATYKITIIVKRLDKEEFSKSILIPLKGDDLDKYRLEYNKILLDEAVGSNGYVQMKFITVSVVKKNIEEARNYFSRVGTDLSAHLNRLGSRAIVLDAKDRLRIFHDFFRPGETGGYHWDMKDAMRKGHNFKDHICPDTFEFKKDHFLMGDRYGRVVFLRDYANFIKDTMLSKLCDFNQSMIMNFDITPISTDVAVRLAKKYALGTETNIANWQRRQNNNNNFSASIPYDLLMQRKETNEFLDDLITRDQRMMHGQMIIVLTADTKEQLDSDTETLFTIGRQNLCQFATLKHQQMDGLNTALPYGVRKINALRTFTTESVAVFIPFRVQEVSDQGGIYYGINAISRNMILCDKRNLLNPNAFRLGVPGSGKSMGAKAELAFLAITTDDDILVCDPESEYGALVEALGGQTIHIAAGSPDRINAMEMVEGYGESKDPIIDKSEFILSLFEQLDRNRSISVIEKGIIDNCLSSIYQSYQRGGPLPTLCVLQDELRKHSDIEAEGLAKSLELFTNGSLNIFAHPTNVNIHSRIVAYDILNLGNQLKTLGLLIITDALINRVSENWKKGKRTHIFIDEFHFVFENDHSSAFFASAWRRFRKRNAYPTGITQNAEVLLESIEARTMLSNSEFIVMNNQAASDRVELSKLLNISEEQLSYVTNADAGCGLLRVGNAIVPFNCMIKPQVAPLLFSLFNTKPGM
ncbi:MAG: TraE family protein [Clostridiales bacterium]|jgi:type IV secretory pathway VirB4 component|nr:TraE family protein [Clostridiales bacterium]